MEADRAAFEKAMQEIEKGLPQSSPGRLEREWKLIREYERMKDNDWKPMVDAPHDIAILARGHDYGNPMNPYHYSLVIYENGEWKGVGNETTWLYVVEWKYV